MISSVFPNIEDKSYPNSTVLEPLITICKDHSAKIALVTGNAVIGRHAIMLISEAFNKLPNRFSGLTLTTRPNRIVTNRDGYIYSVPVGSAVCGLGFEHIMFSNLYPYDYTSEWLSESLGNSQYPGCKIHILEPEF